MDERGVDGRGSNAGNWVERACRLREWRPDTHASHDDHDDHDDSRYNNYIDVDHYHYYDYDAGAHS